MDSDTSEEEFWEWVKSLDEAEREFFSTVADHSKVATRMMVRTFKAGKETEANKLFCSSHN